LVTERSSLARRAAQLRPDYHEVVTAADESEGLELLRSGPVPCAILLDFLMPDASGGRFIAELRRDPRLALVPVVAMTGAFDRSGTEMATARTRKPFRTSQLRELLERVLSAVGGFEQVDAPHRPNSRRGRYDALQPQVPNCPGVP